MELVPMGPGFGVEVKGVGILDVASDGDAYQAVRAAFEEHSLLLFRNQPVADDIQVGFSRAFGPLELTKVASLGAGSFYSRLTNVGLNGELVPLTDRQVLIAQANALWHTDSSFKKTPALASVLTARVLPGGTAFAIDPGEAVYVPVMAPHFVRNGSASSISLSITWRSEWSYAESDSRCFNGIVRKWGINPRAPGRWPASNRAKSLAYRVWRRTFRSAK